MSVGVLLVTHGRLGHELMETAHQMLGCAALPTDAIAIPSDGDPERLRQEVTRRLATLDQGDGVLVLTDAYGSTPSNVAIAAAAGPQRQVVAGVNLPMLVRVYNYPGRGLAETAHIALAGGRRGIMLYRED